MAVCPSSHSRPTEIKFPVSSGECKTSRRVIPEIFTNPFTDAQMEPFFDATPIRDGGILTALVSRDRSENMWDVAPVSKMSRFGFTDALNASS